jgi:hypothetical protein
VLVLEVLPAAKGDCLLVRFGTAEAPGLIVIDGGPAGVYRDALRPRLATLQREHAARIGNDLPLGVDLLMVSHIDDDHIQGILDLASELRDTGASSRPLVEVFSFWHNSFDDILDSRPEQIEDGLASVAGTLPAWDTEDLDLDDDPQARHERRSALHVLASYAQGRELRGFAEVLEWPVNTGFSELVMAAADPARSVVDLADDLRLHVVGPMKKELQELQKRHDAYLRRKGLGQTTPEDALAAYSDRSVPNLSSIVVLLESGPHRMLLTGDASGDKVLEGLEAQGLLPAGGSMKVDVLKLMHHGSDRNVDVDFFQRVLADHYVFCGDGEHGNPERKALEMLFQARPDGGFTLDFNHEIDAIDAERRLEYEKQRERARARRRPPPDPGPWDPEKHAIASFLRDAGAAGVDFVIRTPEAGGRLDIVLA